VQLMSVSNDQQSPSRKLALKRETLRQLTDGELRHVAGGNPSGGSAVSVSSGTSVISSGTSVISSGTSVISVSISGRGGHAK
jgi:hypothetical protein